MSIRRATKSDVDAITWIYLSALSTDTVQHYRFPYKNQYPEDHEKFSRLRQSESLADADRTIMVYETSSLEDPNVKKAVAYSIWKLPGTHIQKKSDSTTEENSQDKDKEQPNIPQRRDANPARMMAFKKACVRVKKEYLDDKYGEQQLYLEMLICHPDFQNRGAGTMLSQWGLDKAKAENLNMTLFASEKGRRLYTKLGFKTVCTFRVQLDGEEEYLELPAMALEAKDMT